MTDEFFILGFAVSLSVLLAWGFKHLPAENWQFIASVPVTKNQDGSWAGFNLTYYGFFSATAYLIATAILCILLGSISVPPKVMLIMAACILGACVPSSRIIARIVEKKPCTFSVQGASFVGILLAPWTILLMNHLMGIQLEVIIVLSAIATSYALGEGIGRLSCISFGCCYGKPLDQMPPILRKLFSHLCFIFHGSTKKIAYADGLDGLRIVPVQAITSILLCLTGVAGIYLFLKGFFVLTFVGVMTVTQIWRFLSEFIRADHRGTGKISTYQYMGLVSIFYTLFIVWLFPVCMYPAHDITLGLQTVWNPSTIIFLQVMWVMTFIYTGRSRVTAASLRFNVLKENI